MSLARDTMRRHYTVILSRYGKPGRETVPFRCSPSAGTDPLLWFTDAHDFGCSKDYATPETAIRAMCADHAVTVHSIAFVREAWS